MDKANCDDFKPEDVLDLVLAKPEGCLEILLPK